MKDQNKYSRTVFGIAIVLALTSVSMFAGGVYVINSKATALTEMRMAAAENDALHMASRTLNEELARTEAARSELQRLVVVGDDGLLRFLTELDTLAAASSVALTSGGLTTEVAAYDALQRLTISLEVIGDQADVLAFLRGLENAPYHVVVADVVMTRTNERIPSEDANDGDTNLQLTLVVTAQDIEL